MLFLYGINAEGSNLFGWGFKNINLKADRDHFRPRLNKIRRKKRNKKLNIFKNVQCPSLQRSGISPVTRYLISLHWCWFWVTQCETEEVQVHTGGFGYFFSFLLLSAARFSLASTWCWCCGWAHTGRCCCWCWDCGGSHWTWGRGLSCWNRWGSRVAAGCRRTPGSRLAGRRTAAFGSEHLGFSHPHHTATENDRKVWFWLYITLWSNLNIFSPNSYKDFVFPYLVNLSKLFYLNQSTSVPQVQMEPVEFGSNVMMLFYHFIPLSYTPNQCLTEKKNCKLIICSCTHRWSKCFIDTGKENSNSLHLKYYSLLNTASKQGLHSNMHWRCNDNYDLIYCATLTRILPEWSEIKLWRSLIQG